MLLLAIFGIWLGFQPQPGANLPLATQAEEQAEYYLEQIEADHQPDLHLWALATLCQHRQQPDLLHAINEMVGSTPALDSIEGPFCGPRSLSELLRELALHTGSPDLMIAALVNAPDPGERRAIYDRLASAIDPETSGTVNYEALAAKIIEHDSIDTSILPADRFHFAHFLLLFNNELLFDHGVITSDYLNRMAETWRTSFIDTQEASLGNTVYLVTLFRVLYVKSNYVRIHDLYEELLRDTLFPVSETRMNIYRYLDYSMTQLSLNDRSLDISRNFTLPLARYFENDVVRLTILLDQGLGLYRIGRINEAHEIYQSILAQSQQDSIPIDEIELYTNLGLTYLKSGDIDSYFELHFDALELAREQNNYDNQLKIYRNLHITSRNNQNETAAFNYLLQAQELAQTYGAMDDLAEVYLSMGTFYRDIRKNNRLASEYLLEADSLTDPETHYRNQIKIYFEIARLAEIEGDFEQAAGMYDEIRQVAYSKQDQPVYLEASIDRAKLQLQAGESNSIRQTIALLTPDNLSRLDFYVLVKAKALQANYMISQGETGEAYRILRPVIDQVVQRARNTADLQSGFWTVRREYLDAIQLYTDLLIETGRPDEAVMALDRLKTINDTKLFQNDMVRSTHLTEQELVQYNRLTTQLDYLRQRQLSTPSGQDVELQSQIDRLSTQKRVLDHKITSMADRNPVSFRQIQNQLNGKDVALHITELNNLYYIATITRRSVDIKKIDLDETRRDLFESAIRELAEGETDLVKLYRIGEILQVDTLPAFADNVILIPDSYLYQLPFDIIPFESPGSPYSYGDQTYFIERYRTEYATSLAELIPTKRANREFEWDFAGFGISEFNTPNSNLLPLPHAALEIQRVSGELDNLASRRSVVNEQSTKETFRSIAPDARVIHLATHSKLSDQDPLFSTIYMSSSNQGSEEGQLNNQIFAYELFEMNLASELIMLNSCESGSGSYLQGSGVVGISRALRYAGAESLALNLWSVNDMMASDFAVQFYRALNTGDSKSEAMRKAKLFFLKQKNANPHYWGPYMLIGDTEPVIEPDRNTNFLFATGFMIYLVALTGIAFGVQSFREKPRLHTEN